MLALAESLGFTKRDDPEAGIVEVRLELRGSGQTALRGNEPGRDA